MAVCFTLRLKGRKARVRGGHLLSMSAVPEQRGRSGSGEGSSLDGLSLRGTCILTAEESEVVVLGVLAELHVAPGLTSLSAHCFPCAETSE